MSDVFKCSTAILLFATTVVSQGMHDTALGSSVKWNKGLLFTIRINSESNSERILKIGLGLAKLDGSD